MHRVLMQDPVFSRLMFMVLTASVACATATTRVDVSLAPMISDTHAVQFFLLESSFPYNAPLSIRNTAGNVYKKYFNTHAGLGVWDTTSDVKFTIEFVSESFVGALFPESDEATGQLIWENSGNVVFTTPTIDSDWLNSQIVCVTSGHAYTQLISYIQTNLVSFQYYQPVEVVYYNATPNVLNNTEYTSDQLQASGNLKVAKRDSFWFTNLLVNQLSTYGADVEAYLTIYASAYQYLTRYDSTPSVVSWTAGGPANEDVFRWYRELRTCYQSNYDITATQLLGGEHFLYSVKACYGEYAYVFLTPTSVYNVSLGNYSAEDSSPKMTRYIFNLLDNGSGTQESLQPVDYVLISVFFAGLIVGTFVILKRICRPQQRRRVSFEGEKVAIRTVDKLTAGSGKSVSVGVGGGGSVGGGARGRAANGGGGDDDSESVRSSEMNHSYYRTKSSDGSLMMSVFSAAVSTMTISGKPSAVLLPGRSNSSVGTDDNSGGSGGSGGDGSGGDGSLGDADTFGSHGGVRGNRSGGDQQGSSKV